MIGERFRLAVYQCAPRLGEPGENARRLAEAAGCAELVVAPELALTGYAVGDDAPRLARPVAPGGPAPIAVPEGSGDLVFGLVEQGAGAECGLVYNSAVHVRAGRVLFRHRKIYLPTYGMFDEGRFFGRGDRVAAYDLGGGWRAGLLVCEDFWHPALAYLLAVQGIHLLLVLAAAPGRGVWDGGEAGGRFGSWDGWERLARATAQLYGVYVVVANRTGVEDGLVFAGGSLVVGPDGAVLARAPADGEALLETTVSLAAVAAARRPGGHARDDDPRLTLRELARVLDAR